MALNQDQLENLKTEVVQTKDQIAKAARLTRYYCKDAYSSKDISQIINGDDWWKSPEILTDMIKYGKAGWQREAVAFLLLQQFNPRTHSGHPYCDLAVSIFSHKPFYDLEVVVSWADYRINQAMKELGHIDKVIWSVDDRNVPLQVMLRDFGFRVSDYLRDDELMVFMR